MRAQTKHVGRYRSQPSTLNNVPITNQILYRTSATWQDNNHSSKLLASSFPSASLQAKESKYLVSTDELHRTSLSRYKTPTIHPKILGKTIQDYYNPQLWKN
jgi:hypothetical protein